MSGHVLTIGTTIMEIIPFKFIHCADLHLGSPYEGIHECNPLIAEFLRNATFVSYENIIDLSIQEKVDFIIIAGDIYDSADRNLRAQYRFNQILKRATESGIQCFLTHGNHDPLSSWESNLKIPQNVYRFNGDIVEKATATRKNEILANIYGISYPQREVRSNLACLFPQKKNDEPFSIGVLHCNVGGIKEHGNYAPCTFDDLLKCSMEYWALGHIHTRRMLRENDPCIIYPGNIQGRSIRETGEKGCYLIQVDEHKNITADFFPTDKVRWFVQEINISDLYSKDDLIDTLLKQKEDLRSKSDGRSAVIRFYLNGRSRLNKDIRDTETRSEIINILRDGEDDRRQFAWVESILVNTRPLIDVSSRRKIDDFVGEFLRIVEMIRTSKDFKSEMRRILTSVTEHSMIAKQIESLTEDELLCLLDDAESMGLDWLIEEEY